MKIFWLLSIVVVTVSCTHKKHSQYKLDDVRKNMTLEQVYGITGEPTSKEDMGSATDENGDATHIVIWHYGNNEQITFVNGKVNDVDADMQATQRQLQHIMDSARATGH